MMHGLLWVNSVAGTVERREWTGFLRSHTPKQRSHICRTKWACDRHTPPVTKCMLELQYRLNSSCVLSLRDSHWFDWFYSTLLMAGSVHPHCSQTGFIWQGFAILCSIPASNPIQWRWMEFICSLWCSRHWKKCFNSNNSFQEKCMLQTVTYIFLGKSNKIDHSEVHNSIFGGYSTELQLWYAV